MSDVKRFMAPGPWITRDLKECVRASDYDALRAERDGFLAALATAEALLAHVDELKALLREAVPMVQSYRRKHDRAFNAAANKLMTEHAEWHAAIIGRTDALLRRIEEATHE